MSKKTFDYDKLRIGSQNELFQLFVTILQNGREISSVPNLIRAIHDLIKDNL